MTNSTLVRESMQDIDAILDSLYGQEVILTSKEHQEGTFLGLCGKKATNYKHYPMTKILTSTDNGAMITNHLGDDFIFTDKRLQSLWISNRKELLLKQNELRKHSCKESVYGHINGHTLRGNPLSDKQVSILLRNLEGELDYLNQKNKEIMENL